MGLSGAKMRPEFGELPPDEREAHDREGAEDAVVLANDALKPCRRTLRYS